MLIDLTVMAVVLGLLSALLLSAVLQRPSNVHPSGEPTPSHASPSVEGRTG